MKQDEWGLNLNVISTLKFRRILQGENVEGA
jgi:hypothetical protein